jgi:hypothetical protein
MWQIALGAFLLITAFTFQAEADAYGSHYSCYSGCGEGSGSSHQGAHYERD